MVFTHYVTLRQTNRKWRPCNTWLNYIAFSLVSFFSNIKLYPKSDLKYISYRVRVVEVVMKVPTPSPTLTSSVCDLSFGVFVLLSSNAHACLHLSPIIRWISSFNTAQILWAIRQLRIFCQNCIYCHDTCINFLIIKCLGKKIKK